MEVHAICTCLQTHLLFSNGPSRPQGLLILVQHGLLAKHTLRRVRHALFRTLPLGPVILLAACPRCSAASCRSVNSRSHHCDLRSLLMVNGPADNLQHL